MPEFYHCFLPILLGALGAFVSQGTCNPGSSSKSLEDGWRIIASSDVSDQQSLFEPNWHSDASTEVKVPCTVLGGLVDAGVVEDPFWGKRLETMSKEPYQQSWYYRNVFDLDGTAPSDYIELNFEGINYRANVWLNGELLASAEEFVGPYKMYRFDVTDRVEPKDNTLVVEIIPPEKDDLSIGWVDWNPYPLDQNMGIWRRVMLRQTGAVSLERPFVSTTLDLQDYSEADVRIQYELENHTDSLQTGSVAFDSEIGRFEETYTLQPRETRKFDLTSETVSELQVSDPNLWWPHGYGDQPLYHLSGNIRIDGVVSDNWSTRFGIREVSDYLNAQGHRGWKVNGVPILIKGAGWVDDLFLRETPARVKAQVEYAKHMNLNMLRLEGFWCATPDFFNLCDENGILVMAGWSCHWEWEVYCHRPTDNYLLIRPEENEFHVASYRDQVLWIRNHPSVFLWSYGSDMIPRPELEAMLDASMDQVDPTRPRLLSCKGEPSAGDSDGVFRSESFGPSAVKMKGPYHYVPPVYWYEDRSYGGAYGFNTETGPGLVPAVYDSVQRFTPEDKLWPLNDVWDFHTGRGEIFGTFADWIRPFEKRYGSFNDVKSFCDWAQVSNYEAIRPMFEAFAAHKPEATGVVQWMYNSAFPNHLWQLFDYYLMPTGAFYGTRDACRSQNVIFDYDRDGILVSNDTVDPLLDASIVASLYNEDSELLWSKTTAALDVAALSTEQVLHLPEQWRSLSDSKDAVYFLDVRIQQADGSELVRNFYWLSGQEEILDYDASSWYQTPIEQSAEFKALRSLPSASVEASLVAKDFAADGERAQAEVRVHNTSDKIAFFVELKLIDSSDHSAILPVFWDENYVSLLPGEDRIIQVSYPVQPAGTDVVLEWNTLNP